MKARIYVVAVATILVFCVLPTCSIYASYLDFEDYDMGPPPENLVDYFTGKGYGAFGMGTNLSINDNNEPGNKSFQFEIVGTPPPLTKQVEVERQVQEISIGSTEQTVAAALMFENNMGDIGDTQYFNVTMFGGPPLSKYFATLERIKTGENSYTNNLMLRYQNGMAITTMASTSITTSPSEDEWFTIKLSARVDLDGYADLKAYYIVDGVVLTDVRKDTQETYLQSSYYSYIRCGGAQIAQLNDFDSDTVSYRIDNLTINPEPATCLMFVSSLLGFGLKMKKKLLLGR
jgi:hypothetical protein